MNQCQSFWLCRMITRKLPNILMYPFKVFRQSPWTFSSAIPSRIDPSLLIEEENSPYYDPAYFYPARIGEILNGRYQIATKLGHGSRSSVWLARDLHQCVLALSHYKVHIDGSGGAGPMSDMWLLKLTPIIPKHGKLLVVLNWRFCDI